MQLSGCWSFLGPQCLRFLGSCASLVTSIQTPWAPSPPSCSVHACWYVTGLVWSLGLGAWRLSENWPWLRCRVWTWFRGSAAVGVQKDLSLLATFPCRTADLGGSLALDPSVQEGLAAPWLFRRLVGTKLRRGSKSGELQGGLVVQNLPDPLAWPGRHPSWRGKASAHTSWLLGSPPCSSDSQS